MKPCVSLRHRLHATAILVVPLAGTVAAVALAIRSGFGALELALLGAMYTLTMLGITVGFHRHVSHAAFGAHPAVRWALLAFGSMAAQGPLFYWVTNHRKHHHKSDHPGDPHSPRFDGDRPLGGLRGLLHAHAGWIFGHRITNVFEYGKDLYKDPLLRHVDRAYYALVLAGLAFPAAIGALASGGPRGALVGLLWGGLVRMFLVQHFVFATNSFAHAYGAQPFATGDQSKNHGVIAILTMGDGWHNNHHAFPSSAYAGLERWEIDLGGWLVTALEKCSLAFNVKRPSAAAIARARRGTDDPRAGEQTTYE